MSGGGHSGGDPHTGAVRKTLIVTALFVGVIVIHSWAVPGDGVDPRAMLALGFVVLASYTFGALVERVGLPHITGYLIAGFLLGPSLAHELPSVFLIDKYLSPFPEGVLNPEVTRQLQPLKTLAIALIALTAGGELKIASLKKGLTAILGVLTGQVILIVGLCVLFVIGVSGVLPQLPVLPGLGEVDLSTAAVLGAVLGSVSIATSPAATIAVINDLRARGPMTSTVLATVVLKDVVVVVCFAVVSAFAAQALGVGGADENLGFYLLKHIGGAVVLGAVIGAGMALYLRYVKAEVLLFLVGTVYVAALLAAELHVESVVLFITAGFVTANFSSEGDRLLENVEKLSLPVYVVFFTLAGAELHLADLKEVAGFAVALFLVRALALYLGTRIGAHFGRASEAMKRSGWLGFVSQAGVALSLAQILGEKMGEPGRALSTLIIAGIALNEMAGPVMLKMGLLRAGEQGARADDDAEATSAKSDSIAPSAGPHSLSDWPEPDRGADAWGEPLKTSSKELNDAVRELQLDLSHLSRDIAEEPLAQFRDEGLGYIRELRREFLRHHRRITVQALDDTTELDASEALRLEQAELAEKWRGAVLTRAARVRQTPGWQAAPIVAAVEAITEGLPETIDAPYEKQSFESKPGDSAFTMMRRGWLKARRTGRRMIGEDMALRTIELRALARYHLWGLLPERLESVAALHAQAEGHLVARTRSIFDGLVLAYDELAGEVEAAKRKQKEESTKPVGKKNGEAVEGADASEGADPAEDDHDAHERDHGFPEETTDRIEKLDLRKLEDFEIERAAKAEQARREEAAKLLEAAQAAGEEPDVLTELEARLQHVRSEVDLELVLAVQEVDRIADDLAVRTSLAIGQCLRDLKSDLAIINTPDLPESRRAANRLYKRREAALEWLEVGTESVRQTSAGIYNRLALEMELHALEGRVKDALEEHASALGRDVRGRGHVQVERVHATIVQARETLSEVLSWGESPSELAERIRELCDPIIRVAAEAARTSTLLRDQLADEGSVTPVLDSLTRSAHGLTDRYEIPAGPIPRAEHRLPPRVGMVDVPFREWVVARIDTALAPRLLASTRDVASKVEPLAHALSELERRVAFNIELAVNELSVVGEETVPESTVALVGDMIGGTLDRNLELFTGYLKESETWGEEVRSAVRDAVLGGLDELRGGLVDGEVGRMRLQMVRQVRGRRLARVLSDLRRSIARASAIVTRATMEALGEERIHRVRKRLGIPASLTSHEIVAGSFDVPGPQASIPMVYRRLFSAQALEAGDILTGRDEALGRALAVLEGERDHLRAVAVVGPDGVGKSAFVNAVERAKRWPKIRELKVKEAVTVEQVDALFEPSSEGHLIVVSGLHWLRSIEPGGFKPLRRFVTKVLEDNGRNAFLVRADSLVWAQSCEIAPLADAFGEVIELGPLSLEALSDAVLARHTVSGHGLVFSAGIQPESGLEELAHQVASPLSRPRQRFFRALHTASGGLLRDALRLWLASVEVVDEPSDFVHLGPVPSPPIYALRRLSRDQVLTLYQVARQGWMSARVCASLFRVDEAKAAARLLALRHLGILERKGDYFRVALHLRGSVHRLLSEKGYIS